MDSAAHPPWMILPPLRDVFSTWRALAMPCSDLPSPLPSCAEQSVKGRGGVVVVVGDKIFHFLEGAIGVLGP